MRINISENEKIVYYWLTKEEKENSILKDSLAPDYKMWKDLGYKVCVFLSGTENLKKLTKELLSYNKEKIGKQTPASA